MYIYKCQNVTIQITGKLKSVILDSCTKIGVVFDTAISACEIVNCKSVQVQATNLCPSFSIDKTDGCVVHLTNEAVGSSSFVTSKSSEMNGELCGVVFFIILCLYITVMFCELCIVLQ